MPDPGVVATATVLSRYANDALETSDTLTSRVLIDPDRDPVTS